MSKKTSQFVCRECGAEYRKWQGQCDSCHNWNSITELRLGSELSGNLHKGTEITLHDLKGDDAPLQRLSSHVQEFDRVLGGGLVPGGVTLIGGDPGIGKSTLLLQILAFLSQQKLESIYISGEESVAQVRMRAKRIGLEEACVRLGAETVLEDILVTIRKHPELKVLVVDSIQTLWSSAIGSAPGTVSQVRSVVHELIQITKATGICLLLVGHVTKEGQIAGPRVVEHMVDTVLYFEGERHGHFRLLRSVKNRFGAVNEIGVFEMCEKGLRQVLNPSAVMLEEHLHPHSGTAVHAGFEGTRPLLVEIQALVSRSSYAAPRRSVVGWDSSRLSMILAVLETRANINFAQSDIFLNVVGGLRITETAADLAVAAALLSAMMDQVIPLKWVFFGEISLSGAVRNVQQPAQRLKEAEKLGFERAYISANTSGQDSSIQIYPVKDVLTLVEFINSSGFERGDKAAYG